MIVTFNTKTEKTGLPLACRNISANWGSCRWVRSQLVVSYLLRAAIFPLTPPGFFRLGHWTPASRGEHGRIRETRTRAENTQGGISKYLELMSENICIDRPQCHPTVSLPMGPFHISISIVLVLGDLCDLLLI